MPFTKTFGTTAGAYSTETLWRKISVRTPAFAWTVSGSGTNEYYCRTSGGANPGFISTPTTNLVFLNGVAAASAALGSLAAGNFGFGDNDALGYSTLYVRLADGADPDSKAYDWVQFQQSPKATEHVRWASDSASITSATGIDQSSVAIGDFVVEAGCQATFGSESLGYLHIDPDRFEFWGEGEAWINLHSAAIPVRVYKTYSPTAGASGLYLKGSALTVIDVMGGDVGLAVRPGDTATATTLRVEGGARLQTGNLLTLTNLHLFNSNATIRGPVTTVILYGGTMKTEENGAITTVTQYGGTYVANSSGTVTTYNGYGGTIDTLQSGAARTITNFNDWPGLTFHYNKEALTITTRTPQASYIQTNSFIGV